MSYSFGKRGATADDVASQVKDELAKVVEQQPVHKLDIEQAQSTTESLLKLLRRPIETEAVYASVSGSIWATESLTTAHQISLNISVGLQAK